MAESISCDVAIVGGGLAGGLIARALGERRGDVDVRLIESAPRLGGNHVWSFFGGDIAPGDKWLVAPLVSHAWRRYSVCFPDLERTLDAPYYSIESEHFHRVIRGALPRGRVMTRKRVLGLSPRAVMLADGTRIEAKGVIDARGPGDLGLLDLGWQKFMGRELALAEPHEAPDPRVMDACVDQVDGYRFVYALPFTATRMFVEDTYFSDSPKLDKKALAQRIDDYAHRRGWSIEGVHREETGVLPIALGGDFESYWRSTGTDVAKAGMRAGLFQPATGYSLPDAVRLAVKIAAERDLSGPALARLTHGHARAAWESRGFYRLLNAMLFRAAEPAERWRVIQRFYRLNPALIRRFYAGQSTWLDKARILAGKPPVPIGRALQAVRETTWR
ncbi:lycopene cyclase [Sphingomonas gilva]|uniref:Lycopene cyclase n=1 Tax=Sphingomonas gilva TaxID=2305907 RepID=A0A396RPY7_9SPHN|nr:lycopene beta-cyclase CrtY [Sphingomonas gilva]RHW18654.1 lycopene cyclase [Sphingomonas gilva]